jgi:hypothetical protein
MDDSGTQAQLWFRQPDPMNGWSPRAPDQALRCSYAVTFASARVPAHEHRAPRRTTGSTPATLGPLRFKREAACLRPVEDGAQCLHGSFDPALALQQGGAAIQLLRVAQGGLQLR